jgi:heterodisulfide reductase subunit C
MVAEAIEIKKIKRNKGEISLADLVTKESGTEVYGCYQCQKCSTGCPTNFAMDILPHQIVRMVQLGLEKDVLTSKTIWVCASCYTCSTRCPNDIDIAYIMDALKKMALTHKVSLGEKDISTFHSSFLSSIKELGRVHELGMVRQYKIRSGGIFKDIPAIIKEAKLGWRMFRKGKLRLSPLRIKGVKDIKEIFQRGNL